MYFLDSACRSFRVPVSKTDICCRKIVYIWKIKTLKHSISTLSKVKWKSNLETIFFKIQSCQKVLIDTVGLLLVFFLFGFFLFLLNTEL